LPLFIKAIKEAQQEPFHTKFIGGKPFKSLKSDYLKALLMDQNPYLIFE
jgi:hypothetical protein